MDSTDLKPEELAALTEAATLILTEIRANPASAVPLLVESLVACGAAAAQQGLAAVNAERVDREEAEEVERLARHRVEAERDEALADLAALTKSRAKERAKGAPQEAIDAASALWPVTVGGGFAVVVDCIASEIYAERDGCAEVAERLSNAVNMTEQDPGCYIAAAIRARNSHK